jgi:hypothetical protein
VPVAELEMYQVHLSPHELDSNHMKKHSYPLMKKILLFSSKGSTEKTRPKLGKYVPVFLFLLPRKKSDHL